MSMQSYVRGFCKAAQGNKAEQPTGVLDAASEYLNRIKGGLKGAWDSIPDGQKALVGGLAGVGSGALGGALLGKILGGSAGRGALLGAGVGGIGGAIYGGNAGVSNVMARQGDKTPDTVQSAAERSKAIRDAASKWKRLGRTIKNNATKAVLEAWNLAGKSAKPVAAKKVPAKADKGAKDMSTHIALPEFSKETLSRMSPGELEKIKAGLTKAYETATRNRRAQITQIEREGKAQGDAVTRAQEQLRSAQMRNTLRSYGLGNRDVEHLLTIPKENLGKGILDAKAARRERIAEIARLKHALDSLKREIQ